MEYFTTDVVVERPNIRQMDEMVLSKCIFKKQSLEKIGVTL